MLGNLESAGLKDAMEMDSGMLMLHLEMKQRYIKYINEVEEIFHRSGF